MKPQKVRDRFISWNDLSKDAKRAYRADLIQELITESANEGSTKLFSEIQDIQENDPIQAHVINMLVETWLLTHGKRAVNDKDISVSIRDELKWQNESQKKSRLSRAFDAFMEKDIKTYTVLIEKNEELASIVEALKHTKEKLEAQIKLELELLNQEQSKVKLECERIRLEAEQKSHLMISNAKLEAQKIHFNELQQSTNKVADLGKELLELIELKKQITADGVDPTILNLKRELRDIKHLDLKNKWQRRIYDDVLNWLAKVKIKMTGYNSSQLTPNMIEVKMTIDIKQLLMFWKDIILFDLTCFYREFGEIETTELVAKLDSLFITDYLYTETITILKYAKASLQHLSRNNFNPLSMNLITTQLKETSEILSQSNNWTKAIQELTARLLDTE